MQGKTETRMDNQINWYETMVPDWSKKYIPLKVQKIWGVTQKAPWTRHSEQLHRNLSQLSLITRAGLTNYWHSEIN